MSPWKRHSSRVCRPKICKHAGACTVVSQQSRLQTQVGMHPPAEVARPTCTAGLDVPVLAEFVLLAARPHVLGRESVRIHHVLLAVVLAAGAQ